MKSNLIYILTVLLGFATCNKSKEPDPCGSIKPTTADFEVFEKYVREESRKDGLAIGSKFWVNYTTDTVLANGVYLKAKQEPGEGISYEWTIGNAKSNLRALTANFVDRERSIQSIPITLKVTNSRPSPCYPMDDGKETFTKSILLIATNRQELNNRVDYFEYYPYSLVNGTFVGTSWDWNSEQYNDPSTPVMLSDDFKLTGKIYQNDTLIVVLGTTKFSDCGNRQNDAGYYYTNHVRKKIRATPFPWIYLCTIWYRLDGFAGFRQYEDDKYDYLGENFRIGKDYNSIEFRINNLLIFKGKRI